MTALALTTSSLFAAPVESAGGRRAGPPEWSAAARCDRAPGPGKVLCSIEARMTGDLRLSWGDVVVVSAPDFARPLRTRLGAADATRRDERGADFALALAALADGDGELSVVVRAVLCDARRCFPARLRASAPVVVGGR